MVLPEKKFKMEVLIWLETAILRLVFANTIFHKRGSVLDILLYPESSMGPSWLGQEKNFFNLASQKLGKSYFMIGFCKYSKCFLSLYVLSTDV